MMKLAWREITFYKFRYILITLIIILLASMVLFITGLAQGLARENISFFEQQHAQHYVMQKMSQPQLEKSNISAQDTSKVRTILQQQPTRLKPQVLTVNQDSLDVMTVTTDKTFKPQLQAGTYPKKAHDIAINNKLTAKGIQIGDKVHFKGHSTHYRVTGVLENTMYAHSSMLWMTQEGFEQLNKQAATVFPVKDLNEEQRSQLADDSKLELVKPDTLQANIASYQAEQAPLNLMVMSLFVITAIVLSAFFYVMTIQKISQIGILKAIGIKTRHLLIALIGQIMFITLFGVSIAVGLIWSLTFVMPVTMPFYIHLTNILVILGGFVLVALIGALLSMIKVLKVDPIEAIGGNAS